MYCLTTRETKLFFNSQSEDNGAYLFVFNSIASFSTLATKAVSVQVLLYVL